MTVAVAAVDLGASSGRVMVGTVTADSVTMTEAARFANVPVQVGETLHWDILRLYQGILDGLRAAGPVESVGVDGWGVDFGLLDADGHLIGNPVHYRDARHASGMSAVLETIAPEELYRTTGIQFMPFNTVFQLAAVPKAQLASARTLLPIPDLISYWLTGEIGAELTNASTTQVLDARTQAWATSIMDRLGLASNLLPALRRPGDNAGMLRPQVLDAAGLTGPVRVTAVGSHDTASAVAGVPARDARFAYISCGTWSLVGVELDAPVLTEASRAANFTNEIGVEATVRYLRNVAGLWLLQESLRVWGTSDVDGLLRAAAALPARRCVIDPDDPVFMPPGDMPARIAAKARQVGQPAPRDPTETVRCIMDSLAVAYRRAVDDARRLSGRDVDVVHLVGGGSANALLCQLTADACGLPVEAGPVEATALGNIVVQAQALGVIDRDRWAARSLLRSTQPTRRYEPSGDHGAWTEAATRVYGG